MPKANNPFVIRNTMLQMDEDGIPYFWFTDALADNNHPDQKTMATWAQDVADPTVDVEVAVKIVVDLQTSVKELLSIDYGSQSDTGGFTVDPEHKPAFDMLKHQLEGALLLLNRVNYA